MTKSNNHASESENPLLRDAALVKQVRQGNDRAFETLVGYYHRMVAAQANIVLRDPELVDDCMQESFITAYRHIANLDDPQRFGPWLKTITLRTCIASAEKEAKRYHREVTGLECDLVDPWSESPGPEGDSIQAWVNDVRKAVAHLSQTQHEILYHFYVADNSLQDIANFLDCPLGTVKRRLHDARKQLRHCVTSESLPEGQGPAHTIMSALKHALNETHQSGDNPL